MMKESILSVTKTIVLILLICGACKSEDQRASTILMDAEYLRNSKTRIQQGDTLLMVAFDQLIKDANKALNELPYSVTNKEN